MIWADRVGLVLALPVVLIGLLQADGSGRAPVGLVLFVLSVWLILRAADFIFAGRVRRRQI